MKNNFKFLDGFFKAVFGSNLLQVGTHPAIFHADEIYALALLRVLGVDMKIRRTRIQAILDTCDVVIDVGGIHDPESLRFDHHQGGDDVHGRSAFGLLLAFVQSKLGNVTFNGMYPLPSRLWEFARQVDARDTRVGYDSKNPWDESLGWISDLNAFNVHGKEQKEAFNLALDFAEEILRGLISRKIHGPSGEVFERLSEAAAEAREAKEAILIERAKKAEIIGVDVDDGRLQAKFASVDEYVGLNDLTKVHGDDVWGSVFLDPQTDEIKITVNTDFIKISEESRGAKFIHKNGFFAVWDGSKWNGIIQDLVLETV